MSRWVKREWELNESCNYYKHMSSGDYILVGVWGGDV